MTDSDYVHKVQILLFRIPVTFSARVASLFGSPIAALALEVSASVPPDHVAKGSLIDAEEVTHAPISALMTRVGIFSLRIVPALVAATSSSAVRAAVFGSPAPSFHAPAALSSVPASQIFRFLLQWRLRIQFLPLLRWCRPVSRPLL